MTQFKPSILMSSLAVAALLGCSAAMAQAPAANEVLQPIEGVQVTAAEVNEVLSTRGVPDSKDMRDRVATELAVRKVIRDAAQAEGFANRADVQKRTREAATDILVESYLQEKSQSPALSDAQVRQRYDALVAAMAPQDVLLRLIAVKSPEGTEKVASALKRGAKFEEVAAQHSEVPAKANGGLLPWVNLREPAGATGSFGIPADVIKVALAMPKGQQSKSATVVDGVSYYVKVEDRRKASIVPFEEAKEELKESMEAQVQQQKAREVVTKLVEQKKAAPQK